LKFDIFCKPPAMKDLMETIKFIVNSATELKNKFTDATTAPVEFACIFSQNKEEYKEFTNQIQLLGKVVERTNTGFTYLLDKPIQTIAGPLRLVKIRRPDIQRTERGDADFNTEYKSFKKKHQDNGMFELVKRETFEMLRLSHPEYDVMACFSNIPKSKNLGITL